MPGIGDAIRKDKMGGLQNGLHRLLVDHGIQQAEREARRRLKGFIRCNPVVASNESWIDGEMIACELILINPLHIVGVEKSEWRNRVSREGRKIEDNHGDAVILTLSLQLDRYGNRVKLAQSVDEFEHTLQDALR